MSELELRCTHCGAIGEIEEETADYFICASCGAKVLKKQSTEMIENIKKLNYETQASQLKNYRELLHNSLNEKNSDLHTKIASEILCILPHDFEANLYLKLSDKKHNPRDYELFLKSIIQFFSVEEIKPYIPFMIKTASFNEINIIDNLIKHFSLDKEFSEHVNKRRDEISKEIDLYANINRDVFICHSSKDKDLLEKIVKEIEYEEGYSVWYSERNMPWDPVDYWDNIKEAIKNCNIFLILITENSKFSPDVRKELSIARDLNKKRRAAYLAMNGNPGAEIRAFLSETGSQWIDSSSPSSLDILSERIHDLLSIKEDPIKSEIKKDKIDIKNQAYSQEMNAQATNCMNLMNRAFSLIEDEEWDKADQKIEQVLDIDAKYALAYVGKLLIEYKINKEEKLKNLKTSFETSKNYEKIKRYGDDEIKNKINSYLDVVKEKIELAERIKHEKEEKKRLEKLENERIERERKEAEERRKAEEKRIEEEKKRLEQERKLAREKQLQEERLREEARRREEEARILEERRIQKEKEREEAAKRKNEEHLIKTAIKKELPDFNFSVIFIDKTTNQINLILNEYVGNNKEVTIPSNLTHGTLIDIEIKDECFANNEKIEKIIIPENVTKIGYHVFFNSQKLKEIKIHKDNETYESSDDGTLIIDKNSKKLIFGLSTTSLTNNHFSKLKEIGASAFEGNTKITSFVAPSSLEIIGPEAFRGCNNLKEITLNGKIKKICDGAFASTAIETLDLPKSIQDFVSTAIDGCKMLQIINYEGSNADFRKVVQGQLNKTIDINCSINLLTLEEAKKQFQLEGNDGQYVIKKYIGKENNVIIPSLTNGVINQINNYAFTCSNVEKITISKDIMLIEPKAFLNCPTLEKIIVDKNNKTYNSNNNCNAIIHTNTDKLIVGCKNTIIPKDITELGEYAFDSTLVEEIIIPDSVKKIGNSCFKDATNLKSVTMPSKLTEIDSFAFNGCSNLKELTIPSTIKSIGLEAFYGTKIKFNCDDAVKHDFKKKLKTFNSVFKCFKTIGIISSILLVALFIYDLVFKGALTIPISIDLVLALISFAVLGKMNEDDVKESESASLRLIGTIFIILTLISVFAYGNKVHDTSFIVILMISLIAISFAFIVFSTCYSIDSEFDFINGLILFSILLFIFELITKGEYIWIYLIIGAVMIIAHIIIMKVYDNPIHVLISLVLNIILLIIAFMLSGKIKLGSSSDNITIITIIQGLNNWIKIIILLILITVGAVFGAVSQREGALNILSYAILGFSFVLYGFIMVVHADDAHVFAIFQGIITLIIGLLLACFMGIDSECSLSLPIFSIAMNVLTLFFGGLTGVYIGTGAGIFTILVTCWSLFSLIFTIYGD